MPNSYLGIEIEYVPGDLSVYKNIMNDLYLLS